MLNESIIYLPSPFLNKSASSLSTPHLLKTRSLTLNILSIIQTYPIPPSYQSIKHLTNRRTIDMWNGYHALLALYGFGVCAEIKRRKLAESFSYIFEDIVIRNTLQYPNWWNERELLRIGKGHQSHLVGLDRSHYSPIFGADFHPLYWPVSSVPVNAFHNMEHLIYGR